MRGGSGDDDWDTGTTLVVPSEPTERDRAYLIVISGDNLGEMFQVGAAEVVIGRTVRSTIELRDDGVSRTHARVRRDGAPLVIEDLGSRNGTFVNGVRLTAPRPLADGDKLHLGHRTVLRFTYHDTLDERFQRQLYEAAMYDALTHACSRRYFLDRLEAELRFARRHEVPLALALLDLDRFKAVNDRHGHPAGDRVLVEVATAVHGHVRAEDMFGRLGGDEFGILCRDTPLPTAAAFAQRVRSVVETLAIDVGGATAQVTVSIGIAAYPEVAAESPRQLIDVADRALLLAKARGRNRVAVHPDPGEETRKYDAAPQAAPDPTPEDDE